MSEPRLVPDGTMAFFRGAPEFRTGSERSAVVAVILGVAVLGLSQIGAATLAPHLPGFDRNDLVPGGTGGMSRSLILILLIAQLMVIAATIILARVSVPGLVASLRLQPPPGGWRTIGRSLLGLVLVALLVNVVAYAVRPADFLVDFRQFLEVVRGPAPGIALTAIGLGAPVSEELLFRGFLLPPLAASAIGFWPAALLVTAGWTALHWGYSLVGLLEVFAIGLYFAWLLWRTGSLWPALVCHAVYNTTLFLGLRFLVP